MSRAELLRAGGALSAASPGVPRKNAHDMKDEIREAGAISRLLELLRTCVDSSSFVVDVVTVVKVLCALACSNHTNMQSMLRLGSVPLLLEMLSPKLGPVINGAAAHLIGVLCSNDLCQQKILCNQGLQVRGGCTSIDLSDSQQIVLTNGEGILRNQGPQVHRESL